jgi:hypothetical protein
MGLLGLATASRRVVGAAHSGYLQGGGGIRRAGGGLGHGGRSQGRRRGGETGGGKGRGGEQCGQGFMPMDDSCVPVRGWTGGVAGSRADGGMLSLVSSRRGFGPDVVSKKFQSSPLARHESGGGGWRRVSLRGASSGGSSAQVRRGWWSIWWACWEQARPHCSMSWVRPSLGETALLH